MKSRKYFIWIFSFILIIPILSQVLAVESELLKLIPNEDEITGWTRDGETYIATDEESLSAYINGAAPFYIEHGAVEVAFQDFVKGDVYVSLEIYRLKDEKSANRLYAEISTEEPITLEGIGMEGRLAEGLVGAYLVEYRQKSLFVRLTITEKSIQSKETILEFAKVVFEKIQAAT